jgi:hypothetical protein
MDLDIEVAGEIVEEQELLNGTRTVALSGATADGAWTLDGVVSWNRGLVDYAGEGDLTLVRGDGAELYATLTRADARGGSEEDEAEVSLSVAYQVDGGMGEFEQGLGAIEGQIRIGGGGFEGRWQLHLDSLDR